MLSIENLSLKYGQSQILTGIGLNAPVGQVTCVTGTNGVGKTSLLKAIAGRHPFSDGSIELDGNKLASGRAALAAKAGIGYVPQGREIFPLMTVVENLETGFACLPKSDRTIPDDIFDLFPVLAEMKTRRGGDLSGGQQQQLSIARALILVEQNFEFAYVNSDHFHIMQRGQITQSLPKSQAKRETLLDALAL